MTTSFEILGPMGCGKVCKGVVLYLQLLHIGEENGNNFLNCDLLFIAKLSTATQATKRLRLQL